MTAAEAYFSLFLSWLGGVSWLIVWHKMTQMSRFSLTVSLTAINFANWYHPAIASHQPAISIQFTVTLRFLLVSKNCQTVLAFTVKWLHVLNIACNFQPNAYGRKLLAMCIVNLAINRASNSRPKVNTLSIARLWRRRDVYSSPTARRPCSQH